MVVGMKDSSVTNFSTGLSQKGVRNHNERLILSLLQRNGDMPGSDLARLAGLSPPAVSAILKRLEQDSLLEKGIPVKGKVGKPSTPMKLAPNGVLSFGLKIGRRSADLLLLDFAGNIRHQRQLKYLRPMPDDVFGFLGQSIAEITDLITRHEATRLCGIGIAAPFEMWNWDHVSSTPSQDLLAWKGVDFKQEVAKITPLPVSIVNDATAACQAEQFYGRGKNFRDYAYIFVGAYVGGGIVLDHSVFEGRQGNAGALGSLRSIGPNGEAMQLVDMASIHQLERRLREVDLDPAVIWDTPQDWSSISRYVDQWLGQTAQELAKAALSTCSVIDFEAILIDGAFPADVRQSLVERVRRYIANQDTRGLIAPRIEAGSIGANARAIGAAGGPIRSQFMLNTHAGLAVA